MGTLTRYDASTALSRSASAAEQDVTRTLHYAGAVMFTGWADLPGGPTGPDGMAWDMARGQTLRRGEQLVQRVTAWGLGTTALWIATAERPLARRHDGKMAPAGPWDVRRQVVQTIGLARLRPAGDSRGNASRPTRTEAAARPIDVLPAAVQRLLTNAGEPLVEAIRWSRDDRAWEDIRGITIGQRHVIAVRALRDETPSGPGPWDLRVWRSERAGVAIGSGQKSLDYRLGDNSDNR